MKHQKAHFSEIQPAFIYLSHAMHILSHCCCYGLYCIALFSLIHTRAYTQDTLILIRCIPSVFDSELIHKVVSRRCLRCVGFCVWQNVCNTHSTWIRYSHYTHSPRTEQNWMVNTENTDHTSVELLLQCDGAWESLWVVHTAHTNIRIFVDFNML